MNYTTSPSLSAESLVRAQQHWQQQHDSASESDRSLKPFTVAVSRETGTYGAAIAREVANRLGWPVYDRELLQRIADDMGIRQTLLESLDERRVDWIHECVASLMSVPEVTESAYFRKLVEALLSLGDHGNCVIVGRGATAVLPLDTTLRVRVVAPIEHRIEAVRQERSLSVKEATIEVQSKDRERNNFVASHFRIEPTNPANYDLVLNAARFSTAECADLVVDALQQLRSHGRSSTTTKVATETR